MPRAWTDPLIKGNVMNDNGLSRRTKALKNIVSNDQEVQLEAKELIQQPIQLEVSAESSLPKKALK